MGTKHDMQNERALRVFNRVLNKLTGKFMRSLALAAKLMRGQGVTLIRIVYYR